MRTFQYIPTSAFRTLAIIVPNVRMESRASGTHLLHGVTNGVHYKVMEYYRIKTLVFPSNRVVLYAFVSF